MPIPSLKSMSIALRLTLGFVSVLALLAAVAGTSTVSMEVVSGQMQQIVDVNNHKTALANSMLNSINQLGLHTRTVALLYDVKLINEEVESVNVAKAGYAQTEAALKTALEASTSTEQERQLFAEIVTAGQKTLPALDTAVKQGVASDNVAAVTTLTDTVRPNETVWRGKVAEFVELQGKLIREATASARDIKHGAFVAEMLCIHFFGWIGSLLISTLGAVLLLWLLGLVKR